MKKLILSLGLVAMCWLSVSAQNFSDFLRNAGKALSDAAAATTSSIFDITGTWTYGGSAIGASSDNILTALAASTGSSTIEAKFDEYLAIAGIKPGIATVTFGSEGKLTITSGKLVIPGSWKKDGTDILFSFPGITAQALKGKVTRNSEGCSILFDSNKLLDALKTALDSAGKVLASNSEIAAIQAVLESIDDLHLGFKLFR